MKISNESKVGIFTAVSITILILGYNYLRGRDLFTSTNTYYAVFNTVDGLIASNPVLINGYRIGQVNHVELLTDDSLKLLVEIEVISSIQVPVNSTIKVYSSDLFGSKAVELVLGDNPKMAQNRDTLIPYMEPGFVDNLNQITEPLRDKVKSILEGLDSTFNGESGAALRKAMEKLPTTMNSLNGTLNSVQNTMDTKVATLLDHAISIEKMILDNEATIKRTFTKIETFTDSLNALHLQQTMSRANDVLASLDTTLTNINNGKGTLGQLATNQSLYDEMEKVSKDLDALLKDLKEHPGRYVRISVFGKKDK
ncbi:MAG: MlaD family protein [Bacteroidia bacterium]